MKPFPMPSTEPRPLAVRFHMSAELNAKCKAVEVRDGLSTESLILLGLAIMIDLVPEERAEVVALVMKLKESRR